MQKKPVLSYELFLKYGGEGGIDSLRSPCGQPTHCVCGLSNWLRQLSNPGRGFSSPLSEDINEKSRYISTGSHLKYGGEGGIDSLRSPCGQPTHCVRGLSNWLRQLSNPGRGFSSPPVVQDAKKSPYFRTSSFSNMAVRGGLTRCARPAGSPLTAFVVCPTGCASCRTPVGGSHPPFRRT